MIIRTDAIKIKCRGFKIDTHKIPNMSNTITRAFIKRDVIYFSCDEPIAIKYSNGKAIMTFQRLGELTMRNKIKIRELTHFKTIPEQDFNGALFTLLSNR